MHRTTEQWQTLRAEAAQGEGDPTCGCDALDEVIRLRQQVERLRDAWKQRPYPFGDAARSLTHILEGDDHE